MVVFADEHTSLLISTDKVTDPRIVKEPYETVYFCEVIHISLHFSPQLSTCIHNTPLATHYAIPKTNDFST